MILGTSPAINKQTQKLRKNIQLSKCHCQETHHSRKLWPIYKSNVTIIVYKYYLFMSVKVEIYPRAERLDCYILRAVGEWNGQFIFHRVDIFKSSHEFKTVNICFISLLHKFHDMIYNLCKLLLQYDKNHRYHKYLSKFNKFIFQTYRYDAVQIWSCNRRKWGNHVRCSHSTFTWCKEGKS